MKKYKLNPDYATHPADTLVEKIKELGWDTEKFSQELGYQKEYVEKLLKKEIEINGEIAEALERAVGIPAEFWISMMMYYKEKYKE